MSSSQRGSKDCRSCCLRRIRCDRTAPHCIKCRNKGIECPGYGTHLRWTNSIASRGRFKGLGAPDLDQPRRSPSNAEPTPGSVDISPPTPSEEPEALPEPVLNQLIHCYTTEIAPINVWVDSPYNQYKCLVIPLAKTQPVLRLAITAIAAAHKPHDPEAGADFSRSARQKAVLLITERLRRLAGMNPEEIHAFVDNDAGSSEAVLAATLVLSNHSLLESDLSLALFHLQAARILIKTLTSNRTSNDDLFIFLRNQVACLDVIACTTLFSSTHIQDAILPELEHGPVVFGYYLHLIHGITLQSHQQQNEETPQDHFSISELEDKFELARGLTLMATARLTETSSDVYRRDVIRLVQSFHHTGMLYAGKRIRGADTSEIERYHSSRLFRVLEQFEEVDAMVWNLSWPIFIGGICSHDNQNFMRIIRDLCQILSRNSFKYYANILTFLEELWGSSHNDWMLIAREWEEKGVPILAV